MSSETDHGDMEQGKSHRRRGIMGCCMLYGYQITRVLILLAIKGVMRPYSAAQVRNEVGELSELPKSACPEEVGWKFTLCSLL